MLDVNKSSKKFLRMKMNLNNCLLKINLYSNFRWFIIVVLSLSFSSLKSNRSVVYGFRFGYVSNGTRKIASWFGGLVLRHNSAADASCVSIRTVTNSSNNKHDELNPQQNRSYVRCNTRSSTSAVIAETVDPTEDVSTTCTPENTSSLNTTREYTTTLLTFHDPSLGDNATLYGLNLSTTKFLSWVQYKLNLTCENSTSLSSFTVRQNIQFDQPGMREKIRFLWKQGILLSDRTEPLATYVSDTERQSTNASVSSHPKEVDHEKAPSQKRGGFRDLLSLYADRLASIVHDEYQDLSISNNNTLYRWMEKEYGIAHVTKLSSLPSPEHPTTETQQIQELQHFLDWFRSRFPYYYDRCDVCGASERDKLNANTDNANTHSPNQTGNNSNEASALQEGGTQEEEDDDKGSFLGYVYPNNDELKGKASRTELYLCKECNSLTRFPRYNSASWIIQHGRGRCGEYSMLLYRMLRTMGYEARWVVDWSDHVFCEVRLRGNSDNKWVHLDPCEAAVNKPLLYQEWGKEQTYIIAFHAPPIPTLFGGKLDMGRLDSQLLIEDVTKMYTSDSQETILKRRDEPATHIESSLVEIQDTLLAKLSSIFMSYEQ